MSTGFPHPHVSVLGGGPSGLAVAWEARSKGLTFDLYEASGRVGGNCITLREGGFLYDSGAHRLHDKDPGTTRLAKKLLGDELAMIEVPSQIYLDGTFIDFPLSPFNLLQGLGVWGFGRAGMKLLRQKLRPHAEPEHFKALAVQAYGQEIADLFLLGYTEKLWGMPADCLSTEVAGKRLKGLNLATFLLEVLRGDQKKTAHLDGAFYYPKWGIGSLFEAMRAELDADRVHLECPVTGLIREANRITSIQTEGDTTHEVDQVVSSLPLNVLLRSMRPAPPRDILDIAADIRFRNVVLVGLFLDRPSVNGNGSMYFPSIEYPFTRVYEPRNRSAAMAPPGQTSLMVEIPCQPSDELWQEDVGSTVQAVQDALVTAGFFGHDEVIGSCVHRIPHAYPVLEAGYREKIAPIQAFFGEIENLSLTGRNGLFAYSHIHDHMVNGRAVVKAIVEAHANRRGPRPSVAA